MPALRFLWVPALQLLWVPALQLLWVPALRLLLSSWVPSGGDLMLKQVRRLVAALAVRGARMMLLDSSPLERGEVAGLRQLLNFSGARPKDECDSCLAHSPA